jgi:hypothetical protein
VKRLIEVPACQPDDAETQMAYLGLFAYTELEALMDRMTPGETEANAALVDAKLLEWGKEASACRCMELMMLASSIRETLAYFTAAMQAQWGLTVATPIDISEARAERLRTLLGIE